MILRQLVPGSLRERLMLSLVAVVVLCSGLQFFVLFDAALSETNKLFDTQMREVANALRAADGSDAQVTDDLQSDMHLVIQIWRADQVKVYQTRRHRTLPNQSAFGFSTVKVDNRDWRVFAAPIQGGVVQVAQSISYRRFKARELALKTRGPIVLLSTFMLFAIFWVVSAVLKPVEHVRKQLQERDIGSLEPLDGSHLPTEMRPLVDEMNSLLQRMSDSIALQQHFIADAAHELRSPLTALKVQIQLLERMRDESTRTAELRRLGLSIDRAIRLTGQLLTLARQDSMRSDEAHKESTELSSLVRDILTDQVMLASVKDIDLSFSDNGEAQVAGDKDSIGILVRNLVDNAIRYTPENGAVAVIIENIDGNVHLSVSDSGPGIPAEFMERVTDRFYRVPGVQAEGSGLGLSIVKTISERIGAQLHFNNIPGSGLQVRITFPALTTPATSVADLEATH